MDTVTVTKLFKEILKADADGRMSAAKQAAERFVLATTRSGDLRDQVRALLVLAWVLRHSRKAEYLHRARDAAGIAVRLTGTSQLRDRTGLRAYAELEQAECGVESERPAEGIQAAVRWRAHADVRIAGWAWTVLGRAQFAQGWTHEAIGALSNAVAEFQRGHDRGSQQRRVYGSRVALARALTKSGELTHGADLLEEDLAYWRQGGTPRRLQILHHLALAENRRLRGDIGEARAVLSWVESSLRSRPELEELWVRFHQHQALCALEWQQRKQARRHFRQAEMIRARLAAERPVEPGAGAVPPLARAQRLGSVRTPSQPRLHRELALVADELADGLGDPLGAEAAGRQRVSTIDQLISDAEHRVRARPGRLAGTLPQDTIATVLSRMDDLGGGPEEYRREATLLVRAGELLAALPEPRLLEAERLVRRALVRLMRLTGVELLEARANRTLAEVLRDSGDPHQGLLFARRAVELLEAERFEMETRRVRKQWRDAQGPAYELAIELAHQCGEHAIGADLVIASRVAGVVRGSVTRLVPVPRLHYIDGSVSSLSGSGECLFV